MNAVVIGSVVRNHLVMCGTKEGETVHFTEGKVNTNHNETYSGEVCCHMCGRRFVGKVIPAHTVPPDVAETRDRLRDGWAGLNSLPMWAIRAAQAKQDAAKKTMRATA